MERIAKASKKAKTMSEKKREVKVGRRNPLKKEIRAET